MLAKNPTDGIEHVALAATIGTHDGGNARGEIDESPVGERLEADHLKRFQIHDLLDNGVLGDWQGNTTISGVFSFPSPICCCV